MLACSPGVFFWCASFHSLTRKSRARTLSTPSPPPWLVAAVRPDPHGAGIFGHLSDSSLGRKGSLTIICLLNGILGCLTAFSPNYAIYTLLRFLSGLGTGGVGMCAFVLATEPIGPTKRGVAGMSAFYFFSAGIALLSGIAYVFQSWRSLYIASSIPSIVFIAIIVPFLSESPRWYLVRGKTKEAMKVMRHMALSNGTTIPQNVELILDDDANKSNNVVTLKDDDTLLEEAREVILKGSLLDILMLPITRVRLLLAIMINFCCAIVYYGLSLNVVNLDTNLYINVLLNAIFELPSYTITAIMADKFGRKPVTIGTMWFSGVFCLLGSIIKSYGIWKNLQMLCGILGIFGMAGTYNLMFVYTMEMFPTVVRNTALGCTTQASQTGAAPLVVMMGSTLPFAVFSVCGIVGGLLLFNLPETLNRPLYDTMAGLEEGEVILSNT
ncbi:organic cation/carnitine transporter 4-like isoform X1 [Chenopodium quinoa]|uniref:organic cation/carnitine transporter 4-like isoform X1 n=1 Tax=Chenopodium quinoa TaxID=63459 RepID=UPI000B77CE8B|nr:organic cation/carnitine transporter 4-like isoform X1 [Chenopodium quinoa]